MNCHDFDERIQQLLDNRQPLAGDADLQDHALVCANCEATLTAYGVLLHGVKQLPRPTLGKGFAPQVVAVAQDRSHGRSGRARSAAPLRWIASLAAVAALALLAVGVGTWANWTSDHAAEPDAVAEQSASGTSRGVVGIALPGPVGKGKQGAGPSETASTHSPPFIDRPAPLDPPQKAAVEYYGYRTAIESLAMQLPGAVDQFESMELYAPSIRPIRESFSTTFETLLKTLPGRADSRESQPPQASWLLYDASRLS